MFANRGPEPASFEMFDEQRPEEPIWVVEARGPIGRMIGLIGTKNLGPATGMLLRTRQVHTFGMKFAIDAIYVASDGRVIRIKTLKPARMGPLVMSAGRVLEVAAGEAERLGIDEGSRLRVRQIPPEHQQSGSGQAEAKKAQ